MATLTIVRGVETTLGWRFKIDPSTPKNLTGYSVLIQIRPYKESDTVLEEWTHLSPEVVFTPNTGSVDLTMLPTTTSAFTFKKAVMDCYAYTTTDGDRSSTIELISDYGVSRP
jgi:hypothetical protein